MTWNLRNFAGDPAQHDLKAMRELIETVRPHVIAFQEVASPSAVRMLVPRHTVFVSPHGGSHAQHVVIAIDNQQLHVAAQPREDRSLTMNGRVRPAWTISLANEQGFVFDVVAVHLKATPDGYSTRQVQWRRLVRLLRARPHDAVVLLGDFNVTGPRHGSAVDEQRELDATLSPLHLHRIPTVGKCSAYWQGVRYDEWLEPTLLDLIYVDAAWNRPLSMAKPLAQCGTHRCQPFRSSDTYPDLLATRMSDHCPLIVDLARR